MALVTVRPAASQTNNLCRLCHSQYLEELSVDTFRRKQRYGQEREYVITDIEVGLCTGCSPPFWQQVGQSVVAFCGGDVEQTYEIAWTTKQHAEMITCAPVGAVADAPTKVQNSNIQMSNQRTNSMFEKDGTVIDSKYKSAVHIIWPYVATLVSSGEANTASSTLCCASRALTNEASRRCKLRSVRHMLVLEKQETIPREKIRKEIKELGVNVTKDELRKIISGINPEYSAEKLKSRVEALWGEKRQEKEHMEAPVPKCLGHEYVFDAGGEHKFMDESDILAVKFGPTTVNKQFYASTPTNLDHAIRERIDKKRTETSLTDEEKEQIKAITDMFIEEMRGPDKDKKPEYKNSQWYGDSHMVKNIASVLLFGDLCPKKWTAKRCQQALEGLMDKYNPKFRFSASVKLEPMQDGKPPRMIIADGDSGAVMSALLIGTLERFVCKVRSKQTIKGKPKAQRMYDICEATQQLVGGARKMEAFMLENDGSAWDTCCKWLLRSLTENRIMDYLMETLSFLIVPWNQFKSARTKANTCEELTLNCSTKGLKIEKWKKLPDAWLIQKDGSAWKYEEHFAIFGKEVKKTIESIRRSGDKGTSILNWVVNMICWHWVLCGGKGAEAFKLNKKTLVDVFGVTRHFMIWCEGDDSLLWLTGPKLTSLEMKKLEDRWVQLGHRPKLFLRKDGDEAEFCGWKIMVDEYGLATDTAMPDLPRMLQNCFYTTAQEALAASKAGQPGVFARAVTPGVVARAGSIASRTPSIALWMLRYVADLGDGELFATELSRDDIYRLGRDDLLEEVMPELWKGTDPILGHAATTVKILDRATKYGDYVSNVETMIANTIAQDGISREAELAVQHGWVRTKEEWNSVMRKLNLFVPGCDEAHFRAIWPRWYDSGGALQGIFK